MSKNEYRESITNILNYLYVVVDKMSVAGKLELSSREATIILTLKNSIPKLLDKLGKDKIKTSKNTTKNLKDFTLYDIYVFYENLIHKGYKLKGGLGVELLATLDHNGIKFASYIAK